MDGERKHLWVRESDEITKRNADKEQKPPFFHGNTGDKHHMTAHIMRWKSNGREDQSKCRENKHHQLVIGFQGGTLPTDCVFTPASQLLVLLLHTVDTLGGERCWEADCWGHAIADSFPSPCFLIVHGMKRRLPKCVLKGLQPECSESMSQGKSFHPEAACRVCPYSNRKSDN